MSKLEILIEEQMWDSINEASRGARRAIEHLPTGERLEALVSAIVDVLADDMNTYERARFWDGQHGARRRLHAVIDELMDRRDRLYEVRAA